MTAAERWRRQLEARAIPRDILDAAPVPPHAFDVAQFARSADEAAARDVDSPTVSAARDVLPPGGSVLDVGCGGGAASLPLVPPAAHLVGVDERADMLAAFAERAAARGVAHTEIVGRWPEVADQAPAADVVVCAHVVYNVADLGPFLAALETRARRRVVVEVTATHPLAWMNPLWRELHGLVLPDGPTADDALAVLRERGVRPTVVSWTGPSRLAAAESEERLAFARQRLCLDERHDPALRRALAAHPPPPTRALVTLWWGDQGARMP